MPARFTATTNAFEKGIENTKPQAAVKIIQGWEDELAKTDVSGVKGIAGDSLHYARRWTPTSRIGTGS